MSINPETGLPDAPEGYRWSIRPKRVMHHGYGYPFEPGYFDDPKLLEIVLEIRGEVAVMEPVYSKFLHRVLHHEKVGVNEEWTETQYVEELKGNNPIAAVNAANRVLKEFAAAKVRADLIGTYPPKTLIVEEEA